MNMMQKITLIGLALVSTASFAGGYAVVDVQKAMLDSNYVKSQLASRDSTLKPTLDKQARLEKEIVALQEKANQANVAQADLEKMSKEYAAKIEELNKNAATLMQTSQNTQQTIERTLFPKVEQIIEELRVAHGYDMILDSKAVLSADKKHDLTSQVTQKINATMK